VSVPQLGEKVAVVTGAAGGIGLSIAKALAADGMSLVLADLNGDRLRDAAEEVRSLGGSAIGVRTDVRSADDVEALARATIEAYGAVDVVCNNAGVWGLGAQWETSLQEWHRIIDVNLWGVIHGVRTFTPLLEKNPHGGHIVNTASMAGLVAGPFRGPYTAAKHAVVGISRGLRSEFRVRKLPIGVSVICPGKVDTAIFDSIGTDESTEDADPPAPADVHDVARSIREADAVPADSVGPIVRDGIKNNDFWILPGVHNQSRAVRREYDQLMDAFAAAEA
jgi:NAD(P)-dependent dehydrogenase (short-subunit alcohol dehydrogenase family)